MYKIKVSLTHQHKAKTAGPRTMKFGEGFFFVMQTPTNYQF